MAFDIFFNKDGQMTDYLYRDGYRKPNYEFLATMQFYRMGYGKSATFISIPDGETYKMFNYLLEKAIPYMDHGILQGKFTFTKKGTVTSIKYLGL